MNGKALPARPGVMDEDYGNRTQFGGPLGGQENSYQRGPRKAASPQTGSPRLNSPAQNGRNIDGVNGHTVLEGYRDEIMNGFEGEKARYNPVSLLPGFCLERGLMYWVDECQTAAELDIAQHQRSDPGPPSRRNCSG